MVSRLGLAVKRAHAHVSHAQPTNCEQLTTQDHAYQLQQGTDTTCILGALLTFAVQHTQTHPTAVARASWQA